MVLLRAHAEERDCNWFVHDENNQQANVDLVIMKTTHALLFQSLYSVNINFVYNHRLQRWVYPISRREKLTGRSCGGVL